MGKVHICGNIEVDVESQASLDVFNAELNIGIILEALIGIGVEVELTTFKATEIEGGLGIIIGGMELGASEEENEIVDDILEHIVMNKILVSDALKERKITNSINAMIEHHITESSHITSISKQIDVILKQDVKSNVARLVNKLSLKSIDEQEQEAINVLDNINIKLEDIKQQKSTYLNKITEISAKLSKIKNYVQYVEKSTKDIDININSNENISELTKSLNLKSGIILFE